MDPNPRQAFWTLPLKIVLLALVIGFSIQVNANSDGLDNVLDMVSEDQNKIVTCEGRCGEDSQLPCSCHPKCFVYKNCCENITFDCPSAQAESYEMYGELVNANAGCGNYGVFIINSCGEIIKKRDVRKLKKLQSKSNSDSKDEFQAAPGTTRWPKYTRDGSDTNSLESDFSDKEKLRDERGEIRSRFRRDLTDIQVEVNNAPVYDSSTGFVYLNAETFFCNGGNESNLIRWDTQFSISSTDGITTFEDIEQRIQLATLSYRPPTFQNYSQAGDPCFDSAISYCISEDYRLYKDCISFISYVSADNMIFNNRFCFQCHRGNDVFYPVYHTKSLGNLVLHDFSVLLSISKLNTLRVVLVDAFQEKEQWADVNCSTESTSRKEQKSCPVQICDRYFVPRPDGTCKVSHNAMIAFGADDYPLTDMEKDQASKFLSCGLEKYLGVKVEDTNSLMLVQNDKNLNETMYVAKMSIFLPSLNQITTSDGTRMSENMTEFFRVLKTFRELRKPRSASVCEFVMDRKGLLDDNGTSIAKMSSFEIITFHKAPKTINNENIKGGGIGGGVTSFCMATSPANEKPTSELFCLQEPIRDNEMDKILEMCNSPCFSDFMENNWRSGGNVELFKPLMIFSLFVVAMVASCINLI